MTGKSLRISTGRAQDWILSVMNPIIDGLRRELRFLPNGPWRWLPNMRSFEYLHPLRSYVPEIYSDNYDDFLAKHPEIVSEFRLHDGLLGELNQAVTTCFDALVESEEGKAFRTTLATEVAKSGRNLDARDVTYFLAYFAAGYRTIPSSYANHDVYNQLPEQTHQKANAVLGSRKDATRDVAKLLHAVNERLVATLVSLRRDIADAYGARIQPVA